MSDWIAIVDDDMANLKVAGMILSRNQYKAAGIRSGRALLDYVRENGAPSLVLLDVRMPEMDGMETLGKLREMEQERGWPATPVLFLSGDENPETREKCLELGAIGFVMKPFVAGDLVENVKRALGGTQEG